MRFSLCVSARFVLRGAIGALALALAAATWADTSPAAAPDLPREPSLPDIALPAIDPGARLDIVAFGTSLTERYDWKAGLAGRLAACTRLPVRVEGIAASAMGSDWALNQGLERARAHVAANGPPDLWLVEFSINDADIRDGISLRRSRENHEALIAALGPLTAPQGSILLMSMNPTQGLVRRIQRLRLGSYYALYPELARANGLGFAALEPRWRQAMRSNPELMGENGALLHDGVHPWSAAARAVIVPPLARMIAAALGVPDCSPPDGAGQ